jgi:predicted enzyme related to lactoylglutathione lyase
MIAVELSAMYATVSGFEIPTRDPERSARFYREVFDWSVEPVAWAGPPYYRVGTGGRGRIHSTRPWVKRTTYSIQSRSTEV